MSCTFSGCLYPLLLKGLRFARTLVFTLSYLLELVIHDLFSPDSRKKYTLEMLLKGW